MKPRLFDEFRACPGMLEAGGERCLNEQYSDVTLFFAPDRSYQGETHFTPNSFGAEGASSV